jgi:hypothetical protein
LPAQGPAFRGPEEERSVATSEADAAGRGSAE